MLDLCSVTRSFAGRTVIESIDLSLPAGEVTALIGPSGCGKSTLLRLMIGLIRPDRGTVRFRGQDLDPHDLTLRHRMGYVIQEGGLFPHLTAGENVALLARYLGWTAVRIRERVTELASLARLPADTLSRYPVQLSGGQRQRVSLMRALMLDPDLLLLDEPLGALDPVIRRQLQQELREIFQSLGKTVALVTHDISEAGFLADTIVLLHRGRIVQRGTLEQLVRQPANDFARQFVRAQRSPLESLREDPA